VNRTVHVYSSSGNWLYDFGSPGTGIGQFTGDLRGLAVDQASGAIYVVDAEAAQIEKFQMSANPATTPPSAVANWGSVGTGPGQMADGGRGVTLDAAGNVWVADYGNYRLLEYSPAGVLLGTFPDPAAPPPPGGFAQVRDVAVDAAGNVWGADSWNNRFQKFAPSGAFLGTWGRRNSDPPYGMDYPRGIGVNPTNGDVWVASTRDHFVRVYDASADYLGTAGNGTDSTATGSFRWPMDIEFVNLGGTEFAWIADYNSGRLKRVDTVAPFTERQSISVSISVYEQNGSLLTRWGPGTCQFSNPWDIDFVNGVLYVTDAQLGRVMAFSTTGSCLGQWGTKGTGPYQFNNPSGISRTRATTGS
jgi:DNA-binding beta-propeller fold protein YncE